MNIDKIVSNLANSGVLGGLAGGAVSGALMSNKKARKTAGTLLKVGGVAALGTMAYKAYKGYQSGQPGAPAPGTATAPANTDPVWQDISEERFEVNTRDVQQGSTALLLIQAMIAAACADGHLDTAERERIMARVDGMGLAAREKAMVFDALQSPLSLAELCERVDSPELAAEVYLSSLLAIERQRTEARLYLDALAFRLGLPEGLAARLHQEVEAEEQAAVA